MRLNELHDVVLTKPVNITALAVMTPRALPPVSQPTAGDPTLNLMMIFPPIWGT